MRGWYVLPLLLLGVCVIGQTPNPPKLYTYYKTATDTAWQWKSFVIDPPFTLAPDASGQVHLGISGLTGFQPALQIGAFTPPNGTMPASCSPGQWLFDTSLPAGSNLSICGAQNQWTRIGQPTAGSGIVISGMQVAVEDAVVPMYYVGQGPPTINCLQGRDFYIDSTNGILSFCKATNTWQATVPAPTGQ